MRLWQFLVANYDLSNFRVFFTIVSSFTLSNYDIRRVYILHRLTYHSFSTGNSPEVRRDLMIATEILLAHVIGESTFCWVFFVLCYCFCLFFCFFHVRRLSLLASLIFELWFDIPNLCQRILTSGSLKYNPRHFQDVVVALKIEKFYLHVRD